jgi:hypothetical protein
VTAVKGELGASRLDMVTILRFSEQRPDGDPVLRLYSVDFVRGLSRLQIAASTTQPHGSALLNDLLIMQSRHGDC